MSDKLLLNIEHKREKNKISGNVHWWCNPKAQRLS